MDAVWGFFRGDFLYLTKFISSYREKILQKY